MAATTKIWLNNSAPSCEDDDLNGFKNENNNLITGSGQSLDTGDNQQTSKAVANYVANGAFYTDSGAANAYVLAAVGSKQAPTAYTDGMRVAFMTANPNTTAASTVNVATLGVKSIKNRADRDPIANDINTKNLIILRFDLANNQFVYDGAKIRALVTRNSSSQLIATGVNTAIVFDTVIYDSGNLFSGGSDEFIIPTGFTRMMVVGNVLFDPDAAGTRRVRPEVNGAAVAGGGETSATPTSAGATGMNVASSDLNVAATDSIKMTVLQDRGAGLNVVGLSPVTFFYIEVN